MEWQEGAFESVLLLTSVYLLDQLSFHWKDMFKGFGWLVFVFKIEVTIFGGTP